MKTWETITRTTIKLECHKDDGSIHLGTGFFYCFRNEGMSIPGIISNNHVLENSIKILFYLTVSEKYRKPNQIYEIITCDIEKGSIFHHPNSFIDLAFLPIASLFNKLEADYYEYYQFNRENILTKEDYDGLDAIEKIYLVGYPEGIWDSKNNLPIVRQGITASNLKELFKGNNIFLIDSACFPGSSGSPVIWYKEATIGDHLQTGIVPPLQYKLLGVLYAIFQCDTKGEIKITNIPHEWIEVLNMKIPMNLGCCIKADEINLLEEMVLHNPHAKILG